MKSLKWIDFDQKKKIYGFSMVKNVSPISTTAIAKHHALLVTATAAHHCNSHAPFSQSVLLYHPNTTTIGQSSQWPLCHQPPTPLLLINNPLPPPRLLQSSALFPQLVLLSSKLTREPVVHPMHYMVQTDLGTCSAGSPISIPPTLLNSQPQRPLYTPPPPLLYPPGTSTFLAKQLHVKNHFEL